MGDTLIEKMYSTSIEGTSDNRDHSNGQVYCSLCSIAPILTDGNPGVAIHHRLWTSREIFQQSYKNKVELAQVLIDRDVF